MSYQTEDDLWYPDVSMIGTVMYLSDEVPDEPRQARRWPWSKRKVEAPKEKPVFGFSRVLGDKE